MSSQSAGKITELHSISSISAIARKRISKKDKIGPPGPAERAATNTIGQVSEVFYHKSSAMMVNLTVFYRRGILGQLICVLVGAPRSPFLIALIIVLSVTLVSGLIIGDAFNQGWDQYG